MKLKKGSPEAKKFMAKLRAKKKKSIGISRSDKQYNKEVELYKYFVIDIQANRVITGWEYLEDAKDDIENYQEKTNYKIVPKSRLKNLNLNNSYKDWIVNDRKKSIGGWAKGNTRMIEMDEKPFKKLKNVRVKRTKYGVFNKFKVIPNMEQFIRDKRKKILGSVTSDNAKQLILNSIDTSDYDVNINTIEDKIRFVEKTFLSEYGYSVTKLGKQKAIQEWLMGLPSILTLPFYNVDILNLAKQWGALKNNATERAEDKILSNYWKLMASQLLQLFNKRKLNKKFY